MSFDPLRYHKLSVFAVLLMLSVHALLVASIIRSYFPTRNEVAHLPAAISHWDFGVYSVYRVNPPWWRMLAVLPVLPQGPKVDCVYVPNQLAERNEWAIADAFAHDNSANYWRLVQLSRIAGLLWSVLGGLVVFAWSQRLWGLAAGFIGLGLWCFNPYILTYAALLTPDMPLTVAGFGATYLYWRYLHESTWERLFWCGTALGIAQLTKFTALLLYPLWIFLSIVDLMAARRDGRWDSGHHFFVPAAVRMVAMFLLSVFVINLGYSFEGSFTPLKDYQFVSKVLRGEDEEPVGNRFKDSWVGNIPVPLPADYLQGIDLQRVDFEGKLNSYLRGEIREQGWWYYYLYAFLVKVPVGTITLVLLAGWLTLVRRPKGAKVIADLFIWLPPFLVFVVVSSQTGFNRHSRYVLLIFPFLFVAVSRLGCYFQPFRWPMAVPVLVLLAWSVVRSLSVFPHSLSYFNELAGGPDNGHYHLIDSNIDWGQDLWFLKDWVENNPDDRPFSLAYHNYIDHKPITGMDFPEPPRDSPKNREGYGAEVLQSVGPHPGYFAVDIHNLKLGPYTYFERFRPIAKAGYSIFIYLITPEDADAARREMGLPPLAPPKEGLRAP